MDARRRSRRIAGVVLALAAVLAMEACAPVPQGGPGSGAPSILRLGDPIVVPAHPDPDPADFDPGRIIDDDAFYDSYALSATQIQSFFEAAACEPSDGVPCLADFRQDTPDEPADPRLDHCAAYRGGPRQSAAEIVADVAVACGVSPATLIVLLQKEQSLVTRPSARGYERATGYGCPDTADCAAEYFGFFNQVYSAAWQFREYTVDPDWRYRIGTVDVAFDPDPACGSAPVRIRNQATANLYNYTPYQPNAALLADPDTDDACASWGNFNFWRIWHRWFGDPLGERFPGFLPPCTNLVGGHRCPSPTEVLERARR